MSLRVDDVMVREVITVQCDLSIKKAADVMNEFGIGCLIARLKGKKLLA